MFFIVHWMDKRQREVLRLVTVTKLRIINTFLSCSPEAGLFVSTHYHRLLRNIEKAQE